MNETRERLLVWDLPVRLFHWALAASFAGAFVTAESERWRDLHVALGYTAGALVLFRILWGFIGTRPARFRSFAFGPRAAWQYLRSLAAGRPGSFTGHNPAGSLAIYALLALGLATGASGWAAFEGLAGDSAEELHELLANAWLVLVVLHVVAVIVTSLLHRENLVAAMISGRKRGEPGEAAASSRPWTAIALLVGIAVVFALGWQSARPAGARGSRGDGESTMAVPRHTNDD